MPDQYPLSSSVTSFRTFQDQIKEVVYLIQRLYQAKEHYTKELEKKYQVSVPQLHCLMTLYEEEPISPSNIAKLMMINSSTVTGIIDRLEQKGLVERSRNYRDRRVINICMTENGKLFIQKAPSPIHQKILDGLKNLSNGEREQIIESLTKISQMLDLDEQDLSLPLES
jgi:DNA-binding MarR family transcriptional regulator